MISKNLSCFTILFLMLLSGLVQAETIAYWTFEGPLDANIVSVADEIGGKTVTALPGTSAGPLVSLTYEEPMPFLGGNTSAFFNNPIPNGESNTGICLMRPDDDQLDFAGATGLTVEAFVKPVENRQSVIVRDYGGTNNLGYWLDTIVDGKFSFHMGNGTASDKTLYSDTDAVTLDEWQHVAGTWDGATMRLYIDANEVNSVAYTAGLINNSGAFGIGAIIRHSGTGGASNEGQYFNGYIDEVRISDAALSPEEFLNNVDLPAMVQFQSGTSQDVESVTTVQLPVLISKAPPEEVNVDYEVTAGTAQGNGVDYTLAAGTISFPQGQTGTQYITININDDAFPEDDETIVVTLSSENVVIGAKDEHTYTILDDDTVPTVEFETAESSGPESQTPVSLTVRLSEPYKNTVSVHYAVTGGTADNGVDYDLPVGVLTFDPHQTSKDISFDVFYDGVPEGPEDIEVTIFLPQNALLGTNQQHQYTILDALINSIGMQLSTIEAGSFQMGSASGDFDEKPVHNVNISNAFYMSTYEVTNAQYEQFDPNHALIDHRGFSHGPNEAVIFVSWDDANAFCTWLSSREGLHYRLPTEAEWEYACKAGTTTKYYTGDTLPSEFYKNQSEQKDPSPVSLNVGNGYANAFGLYDMHGNVEEWCLDYYGPYDSNSRTNPIQMNDTGVKITRGGSHSTSTTFLRSANRLGTVPEDNHWLIGFRVVLGELPAVEPLPNPPMQPYQLNVSQTVPPGIDEAPDPGVSYFYGPRKYVWIPSKLNGGPLYTNHNHVPGIIECPNGDMLTIWYSTIGERDRILNIASSRLRYGQDQWEEASVFWNAPDRNDHTPQIWLDEKTGTIYHFNGISQGYSYNNLAVMLRTSTDNAVTWTKPRVIIPTHDDRHMPIESIFRASNDDFILPCDAVPGGAGGTAIWISSDEGETWYDPGAGKPQPSFVNGGTGAWIAGIHAPVAELTDGRLLSLGRSNDINGMMPMSISSDWGNNWTYSASIFPPIGSGKRAVLIRLHQGPLFFASFGANGLFGCLSYDDGATWSPKRLITDDGPGRSVETTDGALFTMSATNAEPKGYLSICQGRNNLIHLISSRQHYVFNLKYIQKDYTPSFDSYDLLLLGGDWLNGEKLYLNGDLIEDGIINFLDYSIMAKNWIDVTP